MQFSTTLSILAMLAGHGLTKCDAATRLATSRQVIYAYNLATPGASAEAFKKVPWGSPNAAGGCVTTIIPDGGCPVPVATTGSGTYQFAVESRQVFSHLTGEFTDFPHNGTCLVNTNVTLGARNALPVPFTFNGHVYMDYDQNCRIYQARAYAKVPIQVLNLYFNNVNLPSLPSGACGSLPVKTKREAIEFTA